MATRFTRVERAVWEYLWRRFQDGSGSPTVREIARGTFYGHSQCAACLHSLEAKGVIRLYWNGDKIAHRGVVAVSPPAERPDPRPAPRIEWE